MRERNAKLPGHVMPHVSGVVREPREAYDLVLEHVRSEIVYRCEQETHAISGDSIAWFVQGAALDEEDEEEISKARGVSMVKLWRSGISREDLCDQT